PHRCEGCPQAWKRVRRQVDGLGPDPEDAALHELHRSSSRSRSTTDSSRSEKSLQVLEAARASCTASGSSPGADTQIVEHKATRAIGERGRDELNEGGARRPTRARPSYGR